MRDPLTARRGAFPAILFAILATIGPARAQDTPLGTEAPARQHKPNRLANETSPYLLLHAHNPVDWYPWGEAALTKAKRENKPIFLSIGYSSCYWCHVMERESFMDEEIAQFLNENFVCIKVDREERPDIDEIYMTSVQMMTRHGGWPLSVFLTPDARPFLGGTYFPPRSKGQQPGFLDIIQRVSTLWNDRQEDLLKRSEQIAAALREHLQKPGEGAEHLKVESAWPQAVQDAVLKSFDEAFGGFGFNAANPKQPKFPESPKLLFLLARAQRGDDVARGMLLKTLDRMARGGIYDHLGGGFHRYSTDRFWWVPHFEKMLYDNGQLASAYSGAFALTGDDAYRTVALQIAEFVRREMTDSQGGFYAALDAETHAEEGKFYVWSDQQLQRELDKDAYEQLQAAYIWWSDELKGVLPQAEQASFERFFPSGHHPIFEVGHPLMLARPLDEIVPSAGGDSIAQFQKNWGPIRDKLLAVRNLRDRPLTDTKILTSWNGLMIRGMADIGRHCGDEEALAAGVRAADFALQNLRQENGRLWRTHAGGHAKLNAYLDDYAFLVDGLIALHEATGDAKWLTAAVALTDKQNELFWDESAGGFFFTSHDHESLIARAKDPSDVAIPSGNSIAALNLVYLADAAERPEYRERAAKTMQAMLPRMREFPSSMGSMARAMDEFLQP